MRGRSCEASERLRAVPVHRLAPDEGNRDIPVLQLTGRAIFEWLIDRLFGLSGRLTARLGPLTELRTPGLLPSPSRGQLAAFSVTEFGGLYGPGGIGSLVPGALAALATGHLFALGVGLVALATVMAVLAMRSGRAA